MYRTSGGLNVYQKRLTGGKDRNTDFYVNCPQTCSAHFRSICDSYRRLHNVNRDISFIDRIQKRIIRNI